MSEIPSDIASSAAGAPLQSRQAARAKDARRAGQALAVDRQVKSVDEADTTVDTDDADTQVFGDAEGGGGSGRELPDNTTDDEAKNQPPNPGITIDDTGQTHLDLEA